MPHPTPLAMSFLPLDFVKEIILSPHPSPVCTKVVVTNHSDLCTDPCLLKNSQFSYAKTRVLSAKLLLLLVYPWMTVRCWPCTDQKQPPVGCNLTEVCPHWQLVCLCLFSVTGSTKSNWYSTHVPLHWQQFDTLSGLFFPPTYAFLMNNKFTHDGVWPHVSLYKVPF